MAGAKTGAVSAAAGTVVVDQAPDDAWWLMMLQIARTICRDGQSGMLPQTVQQQQDSNQSQQHGMMSHTWPVTPFIVLDVIRPGINQI